MYIHTNPWESLMWPSAVNRSTAYFTYGLMLAVVQVVRKLRKVYGHT